MDSFYTKFTEKKSLSSHRQRMKIFHVVAAAHLAVIFLPLSYFIITDYLKNIRKKEVITVRLVEIPKQVSAKRVKKSGTRRTVRPKKQKTPRKKMVKKQPVKKKTPPVPAKKIPAKKTVAQKTTAKTAAAKPEKPRPKYTPPVVPDDLEVIRPEDLKKVPEKEEPEESADDEVGATYAEQLVGVIYQLWTPPSSQLLNGRKPKVYVKIRFNRQGRVLSARITKGSDFLPMNRSVAELLKNLTQVPAPPPGEPTEIEFVFIPQD